MPMIRIDDSCSINAQVEGPADAPVLMLSNSLGVDLRMWDDQAPELAKRLRLVRYDRRGHGKSSVPKGPYSMERLARDALAVADGLGVKKFSWCGLSMGGMEGQWLGANAADRIEKLILSNTHYHYEDKTPWNDRIRFVREKGIDAIAPIQMERWFTKGFRERRPEVVRRISDILRETKAEGFLGCCEAIRDMDMRQATPRITAPTLVIVGKHDPATPPAEGEHIQQMIKGAKLVSLDAAHLSNVEQPKAYLDTLLDFLAA